MKSAIVIRGARQHNLKNISLEIPRRALTVITGPSGSGKSSLAFDTIFAEGQRRYVESLSAYARQFLDRMDKPDVDSIDGLSPSVAIEQKNPTRTSRSTVGTSTEVYDYLRLLWARVGRTLCPKCGRELRPDTVQGATDRVLALPEGTRFLVAFPLRSSAAVTHDVLVENLRAQGFLRVSADGQLHHLDEIAGTKVDLASAKRLLVVVDRLVVTPDARQRIADAIGTAFRDGDGDCEVIIASSPDSRVPSPESRVPSPESRVPSQSLPPQGESRVPSQSLPPQGESRVPSPESRVPSPESRVPNPESRVPNPASRLAFTERFECPNDGYRAPTPTPQLFSFNSPRGACPRCNGFGATLEYDEALIVPSREKTLRDGALDPWTMPRYDNKRRALAEFCRREGIPMDTPWEALPAAARDQLLNARVRAFKGMIPFLTDLEEKRYKQYIRVFLRRYQTAHECADCGGSKLQPDALNVRVADRTIAEISNMAVNRLLAWLDDVRLSDFEQKVAAHILKEARDRVQFLCDVGLGYLSMHRATRTLSGGEAQRIGLANSLGAQLVDTLYVLDEPSIGLHSRDMDRLLRLLHRLRDAGNTVIVVEHDLEAIRSADHMVELGPGSGEKGGELVFAGPMSRVAESPLTGAYLMGTREIPLPDKRRRVGPRWITLVGARENNLKDVDIRIPLGALTVVTGVSGSGKSTLVHDVLLRALETRLHGESTAKQHLGERVGTFASIAGVDEIDDVVGIDQSPIGKSPRSNPVTYVKAFDEVRRIFADAPLARERRYTPGTFSFNVAGGRCETCEGAGYLEVEMVFMADVFVPCDDCAGRRFKPAVLDVTVRGKSIHDVLNLTVDQAIRFFPKEDKLGQALWQLQQVGLGYLRLGQPATTLSGGESQRLKVARELATATRKSGTKLYIMDEPTTGLHLEDIRKLAGVFDRLVTAGHTVLLVEHNLDVIKLADWVIDLGPEAGDGGGQVVAMGRPEDVAKVAESHTGRWLAPLLQRKPRASLAETA